MTNPSLNRAAATHCQILIHVMKDCRYHFWIKTTVINMYIKVLPHPLKKSFTSTNLYQRCNNLQCSTPHKCIVYFVLKLYDQISVCNTFISKLYKVHICPSRDVRSSSSMTRSLLFIRQTYKNNMLV